MLKALPVALLLVAAPALGQSRVYTNADLGKPIQHDQTVSPAVLAGLAARQFVLPPPAPTGPAVFVIPSREDYPSLMPIEPHPFFGETIYGGWPYGGWFVDHSFLLASSRFSRSRPTPPAPVMSVREQLSMSLAGTLRGCGGARGSVARTIAGC